MENSIKLKVANGLLSALLVAPIFASATTAMAQETDDESATELERELIYHNDFESTNSLDQPIQDAGSTLTHTNDLVFEGNDNDSGVWVTDRGAGWSGIDVRFSGLELEIGQDYAISVLGYLDSDEHIPDGAQLTLQYPDSYGWIDGTEEIEAGQPFLLEGDYTHTDNPNNLAFRVQSNEAGADVEFAIAEILITTEVQEVVEEDGSEDPIEEDEDQDSEEPVEEESDGDTDAEDETVSELDRLFFNDFTENTTGAASAGPAFQHLPGFNNGQGSIYISGRTANWNGADFSFDALGMDPGYIYEVTVRGYVDEDVEVPAGAQALLQSPEGSYPFFTSANFAAGEDFILEHTYTWTDATYQNFRVQSNDEGATVPFYITEVLVEWDADQAPVEDEQPDPDAPPADEFTFIDFENGELNGFESRGDDEVVEVTDADNHTDGGQYSLYTSGRTMEWNGPALRVENYITAGEEYRVSAYVKTDAEAATSFRLSTQVGDSSFNTIDSATISAEDGWVLFEGTYRYSSLGGGFVTIYVETGGGSLANFYIDDINFEHVDSDPVEVQLDLPQIKEVYADDFLIGNAINMAELEGDRLSLLDHHHNLVTTENSMKPEYAYNADREFDFDAQNELVGRITEEGFLLHGHVLVWHQQSPEWLHSNADGTPLSRDAALANMHAHIRAAMTNFGTDVLSWDVVNEALAGDWGNPENWQGQLRDTGWRRAIGDDYVYEAFSYAREVADELGMHDMTLYYNDYNDHIQGKARTMYYMIRDINDQWAEENPDEERKLISGVGMQGHYNINLNPDLVKESIERFEQLEIEIGITELDVTTLTENEYVEAEWNRQGYIYARLFQIFSEHSDSINRVTFWGLNDANSWRSERYPLLFDGRLQAKPAYYGVIDPEGFLADYEEEEIEANSSYAVFGTPEINAEIDAVWSEAPVLNISRFQTAWQGARGTGRVLWDADNLYVLFQVADGQLDVSAENPWEQDSVEAFVNETGATTTSYIDGVGQYRVNYENVASFNPAQYSEGFESAARVLGTGYVVEMAIPWKDVTPAVGHTIGFDLQINDAVEGSRQAVAAWNDLTGQGFQDPTVFGNLTLVNDLSDVDFEDDVIVVEEGEEVEVLPGQTVTIEGNGAVITMPGDLPIGTHMIIRTVDRNDLSELATAGNSLIEVAGQIIDVTMIYPEGSEDYSGEFNLSLRIDEASIEDDVVIYYLNEDLNVWEYVGGERDGDFVNVTVSGFSIYGVFTEETDVSSPSHPVHPEHPGKNKGSHPVHPEHPGRGKTNHPVFEEHPGRGNGRR
ncbi:MAG: endo-1,4-beta-xylanase [Alkalibacterium sp.]|nr:endo-1,4-beta-xylanase [Alkalibacterium sp.]